MICSDIIEEDRIIHRTESYFEKDTVTKAGFIFRFVIYGWLSEVTYTKSGKRVCWINCFTISCIRIFEKQEINITNNSYSRPLARALKFTLESMRDDRPEDLANENLAVIRAASIILRLLAVSSNFFQLAYLSRGVRTVEMTGLCSLVGCTLVSEIILSPFRSSYLPRELHHLLTRRRPPRSLSHHSLWSSYSRVDGIALSIQGQRSSRKSLRRHSSPHSKQGQSQVGAIFQNYKWFSLEWILWLCFLAFS